MSGDTYYSSGSSSSGGGTAAAAETGGMLLGACVVIPAMLAGAAIYGIAKGAVAAGKLGVRAYRKHCEKKAAENAANQEALQKILENRRGRESSAEEIRRRVKESFGERKREPKYDLSHSFEPIVSEHRKKLDAVRDRCYKRTQGHFESQTQPPDENSIGKVREILGEMERRSASISEEYAAKISAEHKSLSHRMSTMFSAARADLDKLAAGTAAYKAKEKEIASERLDAAAAYLAQLTDLSGEYVDQQTVSLLVTSLENAKAQYEKGMNSSAIITAQNVITEVLGIFADAETARLRAAGYADDLEDMLTALTEKIGIDQVKFTFNNTNYTDSLRRFEPEMYESLNNTKDLLWSMLSMDRDTMTEKRYRELLSQIQDLDRSFDAYYDSAWSKMISFYKTNRLANQISEMMKEYADLSCVEAAFEGGREGNPLHINFINNVGDTLVNIVIDGNKVESHIFSDGVYDTELSKSINKVISQITGTPGNCRTPGCHSAEFESVDLKKQRGLTSNDVEANRNKRKAYY